MDRQRSSCSLVEHVLFGAIALGCLVGLVSLSASCGDQSSSESSQSRAQQITNRHDLIGGLNALGEVGDYLLENDKVRLIVQDKGFNRGNGLFGGSLIDADLQRTNAEGDALGGNGHDTFGELFPAFFLEVIDPEQVKVVNDGGDGEAAVVEVSGRGGEFVTMLRYINQVMVNSYDPEIGDVIGDISSGQPTPPTSDKRPLVEFKTRYILEPGARHVRIESTLINRSTETLNFPNKDVLSSLQRFIDLKLDNFTIPTGHVLGLGAVNDIFVPGIGYDLRWGLEEAYRRDVDLPALPGHLTEFVATSNADRDISYGFFSKNNPETNFPYQKDQNGNAYGGRATSNDMLLLFYASGFGGVLTNQMPNELAPSFCEEGVPAEQACQEAFSDCEEGDCEELREQCRANYDQCLEANDDTPDRYTYTNYFVVGEGDVSSITDEIYDIRGVETHEIRGRVFDDLSGESVDSKLSVLFYKPREGEDSSLEERCQPREGDGDDRVEPSIFNQTYTNDEGYFDLELPSGEYCYRTLDDGRPLSDYQSFRVDDGKYLRAKADSRATIQARIANDEGIPLPAKMTVVGTHAYKDDNPPKRDFLYDLEAGQPWKTSDFEADQPDDPSTRQYIEAVTYSGAEGELSKHLRPGEYTLYFSRGPEYELETREVTLEAGETARMNIGLEQVIETPNYMSADLHMHAAGSIDSGLNYDDRVISIAAEDVEVVVSSDHNYVSNYLPYIRRNGLEPWMQSVVGVELTTFEFGHFNAFPLDYEVGEITRGSVPWQRMPPQSIFDELRSQGAISPEKTIIQANHPRDSILGYFGQFGVDGFDTSIEPGFLKGDGLQESATNVLTSASGEAYVRDCRSEDVDCAPECEGDNCDEPRFETQFSWDFDAIEIFNGKRLELLRHYRIPYDANPDDPRDQKWPREVYKTLLTRECENNLETCPVCNDEGCQVPEKEVWKGPLVETCCEEGYSSPVEGVSCNSGDGNSENGGSSGDACPVREIAQTYLSEKYPENAILCDGGEVAYPGGLDDWYNMLNSSRAYIENRPGISQQQNNVYHRVTATGNSDSHHAGKPNVRTPGHPRNYFYAGTDDPQEVESRDLVEAMQNHRNIATNGPFVRMKVRHGDQTADVGQEIEADANEVELEVTVRAAPWIGADRFRIMANGEPLKLEQWNDDVESSELDGQWFELELGDDNTFQTTLTAEVERDTWFVLEVEGDNNLFPVYPPSEVPRIPFDEIINQIAGSFGFGGDIEGLEPSETFAVRPFAFTNPIWVVRDGEGDDDGEFTPIEPEGNRCQGSGLNAHDPSSLKAPAQGRDQARHLREGARLEAADAPLDLNEAREAPLSRPKGDTRDVRTLFRAWGGH